MFCKDQHLMSSLQSNKALAEDGGPTQYKYRRIHHKFLAFHSSQLEYNGSKDANEAD